jgi:hypothetical protein
VVLTDVLGIEIFWDVTLFRLATAYRMLSSSVFSSPTLSFFILTENPSAPFLVRRLQLVTNIIVNFYVIHNRFIIRIYTILVPTNPHKYVNLLKPTGYVMHHQFNIQQLYALPTMYFCVLYLSENKQRLVPFTA